MSVPLAINYDPIWFAAAVAAVPGIIAGVIMFFESRRIRRRFRLQLH